MDKLDRGFSHGYDVADLRGKADRASGPAGENRLQGSFRSRTGGVVDIEDDAPWRARFVVVVGERHRHTAPRQIMAIEIAAKNPPGQEALADAVGGSPARSPVQAPTGA